MVPMTRETAEKISLLNAFTTSMCMTSRMVNAMRAAKAKYMP